MISFTLSSLPGIFKYSNFENFNCLDRIVPYSGFTGLKNIYIYIYIYREREREREREKEIDIYLYPFFSFFA